MRVAEGKKFGKLPPLVACSGLEQNQQNWKRNLDGNRIIRSTLRQTVRPTQGSVILPPEERFCRWLGDIDDLVTLILQEWMEDGSGRGAYALTTCPGYGERRSPT